MLNIRYCSILCLQGPRGDMGETGPPGERGEKGEMGLFGPTVSNEGKPVSIETV